MNYVEKLGLLKGVHELIQRKATGSPEQLAEKLGVSRVSVFRYMKKLKQLGAPVKYNSFRKSYFYENEFNLKLSLFY